MWSDLLTAFRQTRKRGISLEMRTSPAIGYVRCRVLPNDLFSRFSFWRNESISKLSHP
jgi:hypothetical protein